MPISKAERKRPHKLQARYDALCEKHQHEHEMPAKAAEQLGRIEALRREENKARDIVLAGAFVTLAGDGWSASSAVSFARRTSRSPRPKPPMRRRNRLQGRGLSCAVVREADSELTAYRTSTLRNELAQHLATALIALVHALALATFFKGSEGSCLDITPKSAWLSGHAPGIDESFAEKQIAERHTAWAKRLPEEPEALWTFLHGFSGRRVLSFWRIACR